MVFVITCWIVAMVAALCWARVWTGVLTAATLAVLVITQPDALAQWSGWVQLAALGLTPWLLAAQQTTSRQWLKRLHAEEAEQSMRLSEAARSLLSLQAASQQIETQIGQITDIYHVTKETGRALHTQELFTALLEVAPRFLRATGFRLIDLSSPSPTVLRAARAPDGRLVSSTEGAHKAAGVAAAPLLEAEQAIVDRGLSLGRPSMSAGSEPACPLPPGVSRWAWAPLLRERQALGVLVADDLAESQLKPFELVANQLSLQLSRISLYRQVEALAVTDALTGVCVRRHFMERAQEEVARSQRHGLPCTVLMADLDLFKEKNDTYGHLVGDVILKDVATLLQRNLREIDLIARFGGEEFILLLIETQVEQALAIAQRLKQLVEVHPIRAYDELLTQTISIGLAGFPDDASTLEELMERADQALYAAKRSGRNRVVRWSPSLIVHSP